MAGVHPASFVPCMHECVCTVRTKSVRLFAPSLSRAASASALARLPTVERRATASPSTACASMTGGSITSRCTCHGRHLTGGLQAAPLTAKPAAAAGTAACRLTRGTSNIVRRRCRHMHNWPPLLDDTQHRHLLLLLPIGATRGTRSSSPIPQHDRMHRVGRHAAWVCSAVHGIAHA